MKFGKKKMLDNPNFPFPHFINVLIVLIKKILFFKNSFNFIYNISKTLKMLKKEKENIVLG